MRVIDLAKHTGVSGHTIRYYTRCGLLKPAKDSSGYHRYTNDDVVRLGFIRCLRELDLSLDKIQELLSLSENGGIPLSLFHDYLLQEYQREQHEVEDKLEVMQRLQTMMQHWSRLDDRHGISLHELEELLGKLAAD